jgi:SAM-dependent methyltransferase
VRCRVCGSDKPTLAAHFQPYLDYGTEVWDCPDCGSRFALREEDVYERFYASGGSVYGEHMRMAEELREIFRAGDVDALRERLRQVPKNRFIMDSIETRPEVENILETGCGRGYLTSFFIARGYRVLGVDVAPSAIGWAREAFGDHFALSDDARVADGSPYDAIYHVGTIGCVESPFEFTRRLLSLLRPGGILLFNAPNVQVVRKGGGAWIDGSLPPDLVTLFDPPAWKRHFSDLAEVEVTAGSASDGEWAASLAGRMLRGITPGRTLFRRSGGEESRRYDLLRGAALKLSRLIIPVVPARRPPSRFGVHVLMTRKPADK